MLIASLKLIIGKASNFVTLVAFSMFTPCFGKYS